MTHEELRAFDLRIAAYHEAGHAVVARRLGYFAFAMVIPNPGHEHEPGHGAASFWGGRTHRTDPIPHPTHLRMIGLAGPVAEFLIDDDDGCLEAWDVMDHLEYEADTISETDRRSMDGYTYEDVERTVALVREAWAEIESYAAELVAEGEKNYTWHDGVPSVAAAGELGGLERARGPGVDRGSGSGRGWGRGAGRAGEGSGS